MSDHFDSSDDDLEEFIGVLHVPKTLRYFEEVVPQFDDQQYVQHFRVSRAITQQLAERFALSEYFHYQEGDSEKISALKYITVFLWFSANEATSFREVSDRFHISKSSLFKIVKRVTRFLSNLSPEIIRWPTEDEIIEIEDFFRQKGFPGAIGIIDGTHVRIDKPAEDPDSYLNRKHFYSIQAQVVCDHSKRIRDIFVGYPGSVHDSRVFRTSPLCQSLAEKCGNFFILGDSGYPCQRHLLTPFKDRGQLTRRQRNYNYLLSKNRYLIENCFGLMKQKFRQLYHIKIKNIQDLVHFIRACAVLHNLSLHDEFIEANDIPPPDPVNAVFEEEENYAQDDRNGVERRNEIMNSLRFEI